jgi:ADP-ribose pyrophosphatase YjhB (NUDIX family)
VYYVNNKGEKMMSGGIQKANLSVCVILQRKIDNKIAFVMRSNKSWMNHHYSLLAGRVELGEVLADAAIREAKEEGGVDIVRNKLRLKLTMHVRENGEEESWIESFFVASDWVGEPYNAEPDEHSSLEWLDPKKLPENVIPRQREGIIKLLKGDVYAEYGW